MLSKSMLIINNIMSLELPLKKVVDNSLRRSHIYTQ